VLGTIIKNNANIINFAYGSAEQVVNNLATFVAVTKYLKYTNQLNADLEWKRKRIIQQGCTFAKYYQTYAGFLGKIRQTGLYVKTLSETAEFCMIDSLLIKYILDYLKKKQNSDGKFKDSQEKETDLTAFILLAFLENRKKFKEFEDVIIKSQYYLANQIDYTKDLYTLAISTYALCLAKYPSCNRLVNRLERLSQIQNNMKFWQSDLMDVSALDMETTAYALLAYIACDRKVEAIPIMKWLVNKNKSKGNFNTIEATVTLKALAEMARLVYDPNTKINVFDEGDIQIPKQQLTSVTANKINVKAKGRGVGLVDIDYQYHISRYYSNPNPGFSIIPTATLSRNKKELTLKVCVQYISTGSKRNANLAIIEISMLSGFKYDINDFRNIAMEKSLSSRIKVRSTTKRPLTNGFGIIFNFELFFSYFGKLNFKILKRHKTVF
jgi:CD109 antigen